MFAAWIMSAARCMIAHAVTEGIACAFSSSAQHTPPPSREQWETLARLMPGFVDFDNDDRRRDD